MGQSVVLYQTLKIPYLVQITLQNKRARNKATKSSVIDWTDVHFKLIQYDFSQALELQVHFLYNPFKFSLLSYLKNLSFSYALTG